MELKGISIQEESYRGHQTTSVETDHMKFYFSPENGGRLLGLLRDGDEVLSSDSSLNNKAKEVSYEISVEEHGDSTVHVVMRGPICPETGLRITRTFRIESGSDHWSVLHEMENCGDNAVEWGIWDATTVQKKGYVYMPTDMQSPYPEGIRTFAENGQSAEIRGQVIDHFGSIARISCKNQVGFKYGTDSGKGWILGVLEDSDEKPLAYLKSFESTTNHEYGEGCTAEVYNSEKNSSFEMEIHGPTKHLIPGERASFIERQVMIPVEEAPDSELDVLNLVGRELHQVQCSWD